MAVQRDVLVADHALFPVGGRRTQAPGIHAHLGACHEERAARLEPMEAGEIDVASIHDIEGTRLDGKDVQDPHIGHLARADVDESRDRATQVNHCVELHGRLRAAEVGPGEERHAQVDRGGIQGVDRGFEVQAQVIPGVELAGLVDEELGQFRPYSPVALFKRIRQRGAANWLAEAHAIEFVGMGGQACLQVAQAFAPGELHEGHGPELLGAREGANAVVSLVSPNDSVEAGPWHPGHQLGEKRLARIHRRPPLHHPGGTAQTPFQIDTKVLRRDRVEITGAFQKDALGNQTPVIQNMNICSRLFAWASR